MKVIYGLNDLEITSMPAGAVTLGTFDGLHLGHRQIIAVLLEKSRQLGLHSALVTFDPHPQLVLGKRGPIEILTTLDEKLTLLKSTGLETVVVLQFNRQLASYPPDDFVRDILIGEMNMKALVIGYDHAFGKDRAGNKELLAQLSRSEGFDFTVVDEYKANGLNVKSSAIRQLLKVGDYADARKALGCNYFISGKIIKGHGIGKSLGFPTINIEVPSGKLLPREGVYSAIAGFDHAQYQGMIYIGPRLTFDDLRLTVEVNLFDFDGNIPTDHIILELVDYIRPPVKFGTKEELTEKMKNDEIEIRKRFKNKEAVN